MEIFSRILFKFQWVLGFFSSGRSNNSRENNTITSTSNCFVKDNKKASDSSSETNKISMQQKFTDISESKKRQPNISNKKIKESLNQEEKLGNASNRKQKSIRSTPGLRKNTRKQKNVLPSKKKKRSCLLKLVCKESQEIWKIGISFVQRSSAEKFVIKQGLNNLQDDGCNFFGLKSISEEITVESIEGSSANLSSSINDRKKKPIIFKMREGWDGIGRRVDSVSSGHFIIFAPLSCGKRINDPPIAPRDTSDPSWKAHYFSGDKKNDGFDNYPIIISPNTRFSLEGNRIIDSSNYWGKLFGESFPKFFDNENSNIGNDIGKLVVGEDNGGTWNTEVHPSPMISDILKERQSSHYFIRIYNNSNDLIGSMDFRYIKGLQGILINGDSSWHTSVTSSEIKNLEIQFKGDITTELSEDGKGIYSIKDRPNFYIFSPESYSRPILFYCRDNEGRDVEVEITPPFISWRLNNGNWTRKAISMTLEEFKKSEDDLEISTPNHVEEMYAGFCDFHQRFEVTKTDDGKRSFIPLSSFSDNILFERPISRDVFLKIRLSGKERNAFKFKVVQILAKKSMRAENNKSMRKKIKPLKCPPTGKGFSLSEIKDSGVKRIVITSHGYKTDRRRKSVHTKNIEFLKELLALTKKN